tara:strand:+ start:663 stop:2240 length:1578 start_codon:yes stop_codon:yes gene_type:complete
MGLSLRGTTSGAIDINPPAVAGDNAITLPASNGSANQFFKNSGTAGVVTYSSMVETSGGSVGIGTAIPDRPLHVFNGTNDANVKISSTGSGKDARLELIGNSTGTSQIRLGDEASANVGLITYDHSSDFLAFRTSSSERLRITSAGNVGIGTDNPVEPLHVNGDARVDGNLYLDSTKYLSAGGSGTNWGSVQINGGGGGGYEGYSIDGRAVFVHDGSTNMGLYDDVNDHWVLQHSMQAVDSITMLYSGNGNERLRITSAGLVGIGTDNPSQELSIYGTGAVRSEIVCTNYNDAGAGIYLRTMNGGSTVSNATLNTNTTGDLLFWTGTSGASERLRISSAGAFGIAGANYGNAGQVIKSNGSSAAPTWQNLYSYFFYGQQDTQTSIATATYTSLKNLGTRTVALGDASIASWNESEGELTVGASGAGYWFLSCAAGIDDIQSGDFVQVVISKNGTDTALGTNVTTYGRSWNGATANQVTVDNVSGIAELAANDVVRFYVYHNEGSTEPTEPNRCYAMGYRIGGTSG